MRACLRRDADGNAGVLEARSDAARKNDTLLQKKRRNSNILIRWVVAMRGGGDDGGANVSRDAVRDARANFLGRVCSSVRRERVDASTRRLRPRPREIIQRV